MSKFPRNLVIAFTVCSAMAFLYLPSLLAQDATKKASSTTMKTAATSGVPAKATKAEGSASQATLKSTKTADDTSTVPANKNAVAKNSVGKDAVGKDAVGKDAVAKGIVAKDSGTEKSKAASSKLRLPRYFSGIVDEDQREQCLAIQLEYRQKVAELEEELSRVRQDEMTALEKVLTDSQRKLLEKKRSEGKSKASSETTKTASDSDEGGM